VREEHPEEGGSQDVLDDELGGAKPLVRHVDDVDFIFMAMAGHPLRAESSAVEIVMNDLSCRGSLATEENREADSQAQ